MWRLVRRPLPLCAFMVLALAFLSRCTSLDDEIYERQNESTFLAATLMEKLVKFYNLTETFQEKFNRLARYDPFAKTMDKVDKLIIHTQTLAEEYRIVEKLLKDSAMRFDAKKIFDHLYHKSTDHSEELKETLDMAKPGAYLNANQVLDKAKEEYESLKTDLEAARANLLNDFIDSSIVLSEKKLFPEGLAAPDIKESDRLEDVAYADVLMKLHSLYKKCHELEEKANVVKVKVAANDEDVLEAFTVGEKVHELFYKVIPSFIAENKIALSHVVGVTTEKILSMEEQFLKIDLDEAIDSEQEKLIQRVFDAWAESEKLSQVRTAATKVYHKYFDELSHEEREGQRKRDEL